MKLLHSLFFAWVLSVKGQLMPSTRKTYGTTGYYFTGSEVTRLIPAVITSSGIAMGAFAVGVATEPMYRRKRTGRLA